MRREDLFDADSTRHSSPGEEEQAEIQAKLRAQLSNILTVDFDINDGRAASDKQKEEEEGEEEGVSVTQIRDQDQEPEFEFRLFSTTAPQKIVLAPAESSEKLGGFGVGGSYDENSGGIVEPRPLSHYIRGELSDQQKAQFAAAAISAGDILRGARQRAWGLELPWRVSKITVSATSSSSSKGEKGQLGRRGGGGGGGDGRGDVAGKKRKGKLGKKGRIANRIKKKAALELEKQKMTKEEHLKEKKKRLNRERKLKRKQKEKEKKLATGAGNPGEGTGAPAADGGGDDSMSEGEN